MEVCPICKALIYTWDRLAHEQWHEALALSISRKVDGYTEPEKPKRQRRKYPITEVKGVRPPTV